LYLGLTNGIGLYLGLTLAQSEQLRAADRNMLAGLAVIFFVNAGAVVSTIILLGWHIYFKCKGVTTFTYIQYTKDRQGMSDMLKKKLISKKDFNQWKE
jgi:hypothetical protein